MVSFSKVFSRPFHLPLPVLFHLFFLKALNPADRIFSNLQKIVCKHADHSSIIKMGVTVLVFEL